MKLKPPKEKKPRKLTKAQLRVIQRIAESDPPIVVVRVSDAGLHYSIGNGDSINKATAIRLIGRRVLMPNPDSLIPGMSPQSYRLAPQPAPLEISTALEMAS